MMRKFMITCVAVIAVSYTHLDVYKRQVLNMANSVEAFTEDGFEGEMDEQTGGFSFHFTAEISPESQLLMNSLVLGLRNIEKEYGERHIIIRFEEV